MKRIILSILVSSVLLGACTSDRKSEKKEKERIEQQIKEEKEAVEKKINEEETKVEEEKKQELQTKEEKSNISSEKSISKPKKSDSKEPEKEEAESGSILDKIGVSDENNREDGKTFTYKSDKGEKIRVIFKTYNDKRNYIIVKRPGKPNLELDQEEAWAKGAIYRRDTVRMDFDYAKATLRIGDERIDYVGNKEISN